MITINWSVNDKCWWLSQDGFQYGFINEIEHKETQSTCVTYVFCKTDIKSSYHGLRLIPELIFKTYDDMLEYYKNKSDNNDNQ